ncbi:hypothetical protein ODV83_19435, partial [Escherichia coli]|uniref:hypothetical protein n=1 Tax=Escherichia coli TaxID=562 RepID=UPI00385B151C
SVAEKVGQLIDTEATGAPQKHHHTLNELVGIITYYLIVVNLNTSIMLYFLIIICRQNVFTLK